MKLNKLSFLITLTTMAAMILPSCNSSSDSGKSGDGVKTMSDEEKKAIKHIYSTAEAFAALTGGGKVITWGNSIDGGDISKIQDQLNSGVKEIFSTREAFAALKSDGSVVTWGDESYGGDSAKVSGQLSSNVKTIFANGKSFAAIRNDGSVVAWGDKKYGGDLSTVADRLKSGVVSITSSNFGHAALKDEGSVVYWGLGDISTESKYTIGFNAVADRLKSGVKQIYSNYQAFSALKNDGSVVAWGSVSDGADISTVAEELKSGVKKIFSTHGAFAALKEDGSVVTWNKSYKYSDRTGADSSKVADKLKSGVKTIYSNLEAFAALKDDGSVVVWGDDDSGGSIYDKEKIKGDVLEIFAAGNAFAATKKDGSFFTWGSYQYGGTGSDKLQITSDNIHQVASKFDGYSFAKSSEIGDSYKFDSFVVLKKDGSVVSWGEQYSQLRSQWDAPEIKFSEVADKLKSGGKKIFSNLEAYAVLKDDGTVVTWGAPYRGGDSSEAFGAPESKVTPICEELSFFQDFRDILKNSKQTDPTCLRLDVSVQTQLKSMQKDYERMISASFGSTPTIPGIFKGTTKRHEDCSNKILEVYKPNEAKCKLSESYYQFEKTSSNYIEEMKRYEADLP